MRTVFFIPPLNSLSGGLAAIYELAGMLLEQGYEVAVCCPSDSVPGLSGLDGRIERLSWPDVCAGKALSGRDIWCVPEGWPNAMAPALKLQARVLVYVQNWIHLLTTLPPKVRWKQLPVKYLSVSEPVSWFMREVLELESLAVLPPSVADCFFAAGQERVAKEHGEQTGEADDVTAGRPCGSKLVKIAWMPRKNKALASQMREVALNVLARDGLSDKIEFVEISGKSREEVAPLLAASDIFLSSGFPEGFALPPLEAMACGAIPVGFSGQGGFEYMRNPELPGLYEPPFTLASKKWGANGLFVSDGDVMNGGLALARAVKMRLERDPLWGELRREGLRAAQAYSTEKRRAKVAVIWPELIRSFQG